MKISGIEYNARYWIFKTLETVSETFYHLVYIFCYISITLRETGHLVIHEISLFFLNYQCIGRISNKLTMRIVGK